jgi:beta-lactamase superfamily II metal-dependent hydrolase
MIFSFDLLKAHQGDCYLLHCGTKEKPGLVMIDGGPKQVFRPYLIDRLGKIRIARNITEKQMLMVDLLMVSHVDGDHIQGILDLTKEEIMAKDAGEPRLLNVLNFWHNSFEALIEHETGDLTASMKKQFGEAAVSGAEELSDAAKAKVEEECEEDPEVIASSLKVLASIEQGFRLGKDAEKLDFPCNLEFDRKPIVARKNSQALPIAPGLKFTVVGPMDSEVKALRKKHLKWLEDQRKAGKPVPQALAAYIDKSVPNLSSIVVLAEVDDKRMLLTGDARGDKIIEGLQLTGRLGPGKASTMQVDLLKVPHHGSANNLAQDFFGRIIAKHYVFSGNGDYGNPERETLEMLWKARGDEDYTIHLTYPIKEIDARRKEDWKKQQEKEKKSSKKAVREDWSPEKHGLKAFFKANQNFAKKVRIVEKGKPHVIDLLDKVGL